jgi:hypothetical protein
MKYTEDNLRKLAELIDDAYRPYTRDNFQGSNVLEDFLRGDYKTVVEEDKVSFTYSFLMRKLDWEKFCNLTGTNEWAKNEGREFKDNDIYYITESKAKEFNLI